MESVKRIDLGEAQEGAFAIIRSSLPYGFAREARKLGEDERDERADIIIRWLVKQWNLLDVDGGNLPPPQQVQSADLDLIPAEAVAAIVRAAFPAKAQEAEDPNSPSAASSAS